MKLTKENIDEWKKEVDRIFKKKTETTMSLAETLTDAEWLYNCLEDTPEEVVAEELSYWGE